MRSIPHNRLFHGSEELKAIAGVIRSGQWAAGPKLSELEGRMASVAGRTHAVGVSSGVAALRLSLLALGVGRGTAVAVPAYSCVALPNAVLACGGEVVPVDVQDGTWNICPRALNVAMSRHRNIRAVVAVHTFGAPSQIDDLMATGLPVIEDCSHAFGMGTLGGVGSMAILSLYASKLLGAGEGGMVITSDAALADRVRAERDYSDKSPSAMRLNEKMTDMEATLALCQLDRLAEVILRRDKLERRYTAAFKPLLDVGVCDLPINMSNRIWYRYAVKVKKPDQVIDSMASYGIIVARPVEDWGGAIDSTPAAREAYAHLVSLPLYPSLTIREQDRVISVFKSVLSNTQPL